MKAAVKALVELYKIRLSMLGDMANLGEDEIKYHREVKRLFSGLNKT